MSVLDRFVRIRGYRNRAADYYRLAAKHFSFDVRQRYLAIADHYAALADGELFADRLARKQRLQEMAAERKRRSAAPPPHPTPTGPPKLRVIAGGAERVQRARSGGLTVHGVARDRGRTSRA